MCDTHDPDGERVDTTNVHMYCTERVVERQARRTQTQCLAFVIQYYTMLHLLVRFTFSDIYR